MPTIFPAIIRAQYEPDSGGFPAFESAFQQAADRGRQQFEKMYSDVRALANSALNLPSNSAGSLNLDVGKYKAAADAAERNAVALREIAAAARRVAETDPSPFLHRQAQAASAAAIEARTYAQATAQEALAMERLQSELNRTKTATERLASSQHASVRSAGAQRQAFIGVGQQLQDTVISLQGGQRASTVFAQQLPQLAFALSSAGGAIGRIATTLAGPWGIALVGASFLLGGFVDKLFASKDAADAAKAGADGLSDAQSALGGIFDLTSGKIESQNELLRLNARLTAINLRAEALKAGASSADVFANAGRTDSTSDVRRSLQRGGGGILGAVIGAADTVTGGRHTTNRALGNAQNLQSILRGVQGGRVSPEDALRLSESQDFTGTKITKAAFQQAIIDRTASEAKQKIADLIDQSLNDGKLAAGLRKADHSKPKRGPKGPSAESIANKAFQRTEFGQDTAAKILGITEQFDRVPAAVAKVNATLRQLDDLVTDIEKRKPPNYQALLDQIDQARPKVQAGLVQPLKDMIDAANEAAAIQGLIIAGRTTEAAVLERSLGLTRQMGPLTADQVGSVRAIVIAEQQRARLLQIQTEAQQRQLEIVGRTQDNIRSTIGDLLRGRGFNAIGDAFKRQIDIAIDGLADQITESLFGDAFRSQKERILGLDRVSEAGSQLAGQVNEIGSTLTASNDNTVAQLDRLASAAGQAADALATEGQDIIVTGRREAPKSIDNKLNKDISKVGASLGKFGQALNTVFQSAAIGQTVSGFAKSLGLKQSKLGAQAGGAIGGAFFGPLGAAVGGFIGGTIGGLFKKTPKGSTTINSLSGNLAYSGSGKLKDSVLSTGNAVRDSLSGIIEQLGGTEGKFSVSIGQRKGKFVVDPSGQGRTKGSGVQSFASEAEASRAALLDAINDGAVAGIRQGAQNLLRAGTDIEKQLTKAVKFQDVFKRLKAIKDPVGAALDSLNVEFTNLKNIFTEASASAADFAALEELYGLERAKAVKDATEQFTGALQSLINDLKTGDNGLSLRDRLSNARQAFDPLANDVRAGKTVDYDKFATDAKLVIDIQRQLSGSTNDYFNTFNEVLSLTEKALAGQQNVVSIASAGSNPFTTPSNANTPVVAAIDKQTADLIAGLLPTLAAINLNFGRLSAAGQVASTGYAMASRLNF